MRIVIDMQGAQSESRYRGIGRLTLTLAKTLVRERQQHEVLLALSGLFPETIEPIRAAFSDLMPQENIRVWYAPGPTREVDPVNRWRREIAERIREAFLLSLQPDVVLIASLFEGLGDDAITSIGVFDTQTPTVVILHDLIPLISPDIHYRSESVYQEYYRRKISSLKRAKLLLSVSDSSRREALSTGWFSEHDVVTIFEACDSSFQVLNMSQSEKLALTTRLGISRSFVMYTGGADERKNLKRLVEAYAGLPDPLRHRHQLVIVGKMPESSISDLHYVARRSGLGRNELVFTGYVDDADLIKLYNSCQLFVFPSLHEGFGLPPLEAMACGAPVIAANTTSLPEVIGRVEAMFDPKSTESIKERMNQALSNEGFRSTLAREGLIEAKRFSWDRSARRALDALQKFESNSARRVSPSLNFEHTSIFRPSKNKILLVKLDHMGDLMLATPAMSKLRARYPFATIEIVVGSWNVPLAEQLGLFDKIHVFDYFRQQSDQAPSATDTELKSLLSQLGVYDIAIDLRRQSDTRFVLVHVNAALKIGYKTFDLSTDSALHIALSSFVDIPFKNTPLNAKSASIQMLDLIDALPEDVNDFVNLPALCEKSAAKGLCVAMFPSAGNNVKEWGFAKFAALAASMANETSVEVVNVYLAKADDILKEAFSLGPKIHVHAGLEFSELAKSLSGNAVCVANNSFGVHLAAYLGLTVVGVYGGHETVEEWGPVFGDSYVIHRQAHCSPCHIAQRTDCKNDMYCLADISVNDVRACIMQAIGAIRQGEDTRESEPVPVFNVRRVTNRLLASIAVLEHKFDEQACIAIAQSIATSIPSPRLKRCLFVDVSELIHGDAKTGIQRVTRSMLRALQDSPPAGFKVTPVYAVMDRIGYSFSDKFSKAFFGQKTSSNVTDEPIEFTAGDVFLGLDLQPGVVAAQRKYFQHMRRNGVKVAFVVYDLLPVKMPQFFPTANANSFKTWLQVVAEADGALCISKTVAEELANWMNDSAPKRLRPFKIGTFYNGADIENSNPTLGLPSESTKVLQVLGSRPSFLMVGTLEPRKGHAQTLDAFERLWAEGLDVNLIIVGKWGWNVESLVERLRNHPELKKRLIWLEGISDEYLDQVYAVCTCLIAASEGEGFGLPLIEAARHKLPILARDIPVFKEVAGTNAFYFSGLTAVQMADAVKRWLALFHERNQPKSDNLKWLTWKESAQQLVDSLLSL